MAENGLGRSWNLPEVSRQYHRRPNTLSLGGQGTPRGLAKIWRDTTQRRIAILFGVGSHLWEDSSLEWESLWDSSVLMVQPYALGHLYKVRQGGERDTEVLSTLIVANCF